MADHIVLAAALLAPVTSAAIVYVFWIRKRPNALWWGPAILLYFPAVILFVVDRIWGKREPHALSWRAVASVFALGVLAVPLAGQLQRWVRPWILQEFYHPVSREVVGHRSPVIPERYLPPVYLPNSLGSEFIAEVIWAGLIEESLKLAAVLAVFWQRHVSKSVHGLIYGTVAALGFCCGENGYHYFAGGLDWSRPLLILPHPMWACFWAASLGRAKSLGWARGIALVLLGLLASAIAHGLANTIFGLAEEQFLTDLFSEHWVAQWLIHLRFPLLALMLGTYISLGIALERAGEKATA